MTTCKPGSRCKRVTGPVWTEDQCRYCWVKRYGIGKPRGPLTPSETLELFGQNDPELLGDRVAKLITALGFPPCGGCERRKGWLNRAHAWLRMAASSVSRAGKPRPEAPPYFSSAQRAKDTLSLVARLPHDLAAVCGVSRSGIAPAVELAMAMHLPLFTVSDAVTDPGNGYRLNGHNELRPGPILVMDDSRGSGASQRKAMAIAAAHWPDRQLLFAVLYCNTTPREAVPLPDFYVRELFHPHLFEWNLFNSPYFAHEVGTDFDGILCHDWPGNAQQPRWQEGDEYEAWLATAPPLHLPRRDPLPLIVTGRLEKHRAATEAWLAKHRIGCRKLVMWPGTSQQRWQQTSGISAVARWKAEKYAKRKLSLYVESDPEQAKQIAKLAGRPVLCPAAEKVFV